MINVYPCGTKVMTGEFDDIHGVIISVNITGNDIVYEIGYWDGSDYKNVKLYEYEFTVAEPAKKSVGYRVPLYKENT